MQEVPSVYTSPFLHTDERKMALCNSYLFPPPGISKTKRSRENCMQRILGLKSVNGSQDSCSSQEQDCLALKA